MPNELSSFEKKLKALRREDELLLSWLFEALYADKGLKRQGLRLAYNAEGTRGEVWYGSRLVLEFWAKGGRLLMRSSSDGEGAVQMFKGLDPAARDRAIDLLARAVHLGPGRR